MNRLKLALFGFFAVAVFAASGCDKCKDTSVLALEEGNQGFSITYVDSNGNNITSAISGKVFVSTEGPQGQYVVVQQDNSDGTFGPFDFANSPGPISKGVPYDYVYILDLDNMKNDTVRIKFVAAVDECHEFWQQVDYFVNQGTDAYSINVPEPESGSETASFTIIK